MLVQQMSARIFDLMLRMDRLCTCDTSDRLCTCDTSDRLCTYDTSDRLCTCDTSDRLCTCDTSDRFCTCDTNVIYVQSLSSTWEQIHEPVSVAPPRSLLHQQSPKLHILLNTDWAIGTKKCPLAPKVWWKLQYSSGLNF